MTSSDDMQKAVGLPELIDPAHEYVYRSGEFGIYYYWYKDKAENYWKYSNAPEGHPHFDPHAGVALMDPDQPMPHTAPEFYTPEGRKRHIAVPQGMQTEVNPAYDPKNPKNIWYELYRSEDGEVRYVYLDTDIRENLDLYIQQQLRVADAGLLNYRQMAANLFAKTHPKDRVTGALLMLVDQGLFEVEELSEATVGDLEFADNTIRLLGHKFIGDKLFHDFMTSLVGDREPTAPLFVLDTVHGRNQLGLRYLYSVFASLKVSPHFLLYWHASHMFSKIMNRLAMQQVPPEEIEEKALGELGRVLNTREDIQHLIDFKLRETLLDSYTAQQEEAKASQVNGTAPSADTPTSMVEKSLDRVSVDDWGVSQIWSDLVERTGEELQFSTWLHNEPLHDITPEEQALVEEAMQAEHEAQQQAEAPAGDTPSPGAEPGTSPQAPKGTE